MLKACAGCGFIKDAEKDFYLRDTKNNIPRNLCKQCDNEARKAHPKRRGRRGKSKRHGSGRLSKMEYQLKHDEQKGVCKICGGTSKRKLAVDHDHKTQQIRALLCGRCNLGLGFFRDSPELLRNAADYLVSYK